MKRNRNLVFDLGMHLGQDTDFYLRKGYEVIGIEADPVLVRHCERRFASHIENGQLHILSGAIAPPNFGDEITLFRNPVSEWNSVDRDWAERRGSVDSIVVPRIDLHQVFFSYDVPYYLKIDIEGMDRFVLQTLTDLSERPIHISLESEKRDWNKLVAEVESLSSLGYTGFRAVQQEWIHKTPVTARSLQGETFVHRFHIGASGPFGDDLNQPWKDKEGILSEYRSIFRRYQFGGDDSLIYRAPLGAAMMARISRAAGRPLVGWYDIHATL